jgi:hypothetical protein
VKGKGGSKAEECFTFEWEREQKPHVESCWT